MDGTLAGGIRGWSQHAYVVKYIVSGERKEVQVEWMGPYADVSLAVTVELLKILIILRNQGEFHTEAFHAVVTNADNDTELVAQVRWADFDELEITQELVANIYQDARAYLVSQSYNMKLTKATRSAL